MNLFDDVLHFNSGKPFHRIYPMKDGEVEYYEAFFPPEIADEYYRRLLSDVKWRETKTVVYGQEFDTPRLSAWYGDEGAAYSFSGNRHEPFPWTKDLLSIKERIETVSPVTFNSVLLNFYRTGKDSVGWHRDDESEFGKNPVIGSVSFGETRPFQLKHKFDKTQQKIVIPLQHGSLLIMKGSTQHFWEHQIPKTTKSIRPRINLTFRVIKFVRS